MDRPALKRETYGLIIGQAFCLYAKKRSEDDAE